MDTCRIDALAVFTNDQLYSSWLVLIAIDD